MSQSQLIDKVLADAESCLAISVRSTPEEYHQALETAKQWGLVERHNNSNSYCLTKVGRLALNLGGFDLWLEYEKRSTSPRQSIHIGGSVTGSQIGQDSRFKNLTTSSITSPVPGENENQQSGLIAMLQRWIIPIIVTVIGGVILLYIEHKTGFFSGK